MKREKQFVEQEDKDGCVGGYGHDWVLQDTAGDWLLMRCKGCEGLRWFKPTDWYKKAQLLCRECEFKEDECECEYCSHCGSNLDYYDSAIACEKCGGCDLECGCMCVEVTA